MGYDGNLNTQHTKKTTFVVDVLGNMPLTSKRLVFLSLFTHIFMHNTKRHLL